MCGRRTVGILCVVGGQWVFYVCKEDSGYSMCVRRTVGIICELGGQWVFYVC